MTTKKKTPLGPRKEPQQARSVATVSAILEGVAQVLETDGFERMTTTRVAARAGTSVGTLYQYFPSKDALLVAAVNEKMARIDRALSRVFELPATAPLAAHIRVMIQALIDEKRRRPRLNVELSRQTPRLEKQQLVARTLDRAQGMVRALLDAHQHEIAVMNTDLAAWLVVHAVNGMIDGALFEGPQRLADPSLEGAIVTHVLGALGAGEAIPPRMDERLVHRGDIFWVATDNSRSPTPVYSHPHVVVQDDVLNHSRISTVVVCALTTNLAKANEPGNILLDPGEGDLPKRSAVVVSQISSIERSRLGERIGALSEGRVDEVLAGLRFQQRSFFGRQSKTQS